MDWCGFLIVKRWSWRLLKILKKVQKIAIDETVTVQCTARILSSAFLWRSTHGFGYVSSFFGDVLFIFSIFHSRKALYRINYFWEYSEEIKIKMRNFSWNERVDNREAWDGTAEEERGGNLACTRSFTITLYFCTLVEKQCLINYWNWIQLNILT